MPVVHLHKDVTPREYCPSLFDALKDWPRMSAAAEYGCGVLQAMKERRQLIRDFVTHHCNGLRYGYGWREFLNPQLEDVGVEGQPVVTIETHHRSEDLTVYEDHPKAKALVETAREHGYEHMSL